MNEYTTDQDLLYQARLQSLREEYATANYTSPTLPKSHSLSNDEIKDFIKARVKEAKWAKKSSATMNNFNDCMLWAVITLLTLSVGGLIYIGYLVTQLGG